MKKHIGLLTLLLAGALCFSFVGCGGNGDGGNGGSGGSGNGGTEQGGGNGGSGDSGNGGNGGGGDQLTQAELSTLYANAAISAYEKTGITDPNAQTASLTSLIIPDNTTPATDANAIKNVQLNIGAMPAVLKMVSDLYANDNFIITDDVVNFTVNVELPSGPSGTETFQQEYSLLNTVDVANGKIYLEAAVTVNGMTQYNYGDIDFDFTTNEIISFRYLAHMGDMGQYGDIKVDAQNNMYMNDPANASSDFIEALDSLKAAFDEKVAVGQNLSADFSAEVQTYMDTTMAISSSLRS